MSEDLHSMFWPSSIAVVGASPNLSTYGGQTVDMLLAHSFPGTIIPVNPKYQTIAGLRCAPTIVSIDQPIDLALILLPTASVVDVVRECADVGVGSIAIFSSGFAEVDATGAAEQREVLSLAQAADMRVLGPNCQGFFNVHASVAATFSPAADPRRGLEFVRAGNVSVASQSGALGFAVFNSGSALGLGFSQIITCGNSADVDLLDVLDFLIDDEHTDVILAILEGLDDGSRFRQIAAVG